jgi:phage baseplate assembly protein W
MSFKIESNIVNQVNDAGIGIKLQFDSTKLFTTTYTTNDQVISNLKNLLLTRKGERYLQPLFGTELLNLIFEPNTDFLVDAIQTTISEAIAFWLPYVSINSIQVITNQQDPTLEHLVKVLITVTILPTGSEQKITIFSNENGTFEIQEEAVNGTN